MHQLSFTAPPPQGVSPHLRQRHQRHHSAAGQPRRSTLNCPHKLQAGRVSKAATTNPAAASAQQHQETNWRYLLPRQAIAMFAAGAVLGPFCDALHSQHDVLHYVHPSVSLQLDSPVHWSFETCWWVPLLFGVAGLILGVSVPVLDELSAPASSSHRSAASPTSASASVDAKQPRQVRMGLQAQGSWPWVLLCIALFVTQYGLSGMLEQPLLGKTLEELGGVPVLDVVLASYALLLWAVFDASPQGFAMAALTALCGPVIEVLLINAGGLYHYTHPVLFGAVPTWIGWVYFAGGPAVGNLGRIVWQTLSAKEEEEEELRGKLQR